MVAVLVVLAFQLFPRQSYTVLSDGRALRVSATFDQERAALDAARVALSPGDDVVIGRGGSQASLAVRRAMPVTIAADGAVLELRTQAETVAGALAAAGIEIRPQDRIYVDGRLATARALLESAVYATTPENAVALSSSVSGRGEASVVGIEVVRARPVTVIVDRTRTEALSAARTVAGVLADLGMHVREGDLVSPALDAEVASGTTIRLAQAKTISVTVDGQAEALYTQARTVGDVLALFEIELGEADSVTPAVTTIVREGMEIVVSLVRTREEEVIETIPAPVRYETDHTLPAGSERVVEGHAGERVVRYLVTYENGVEVARELAGAEVLTEPIPTRHISAPAVEAERPTLDAPGYSGPYIEKFRVWATWYNATHGGKTRDHPAYGITYSGIPLDYGICAVDPAVIPLYTRFYVPGYGECLAADTGGLINGYDVDLGFPESAGWNPWHTGYVDIYILDWG